MRGLTETSERKAYVGYSDAGMLLAALYRAGFEAVAHGPVAQDILRHAGDVAVARALAWMIDRAPEALEPTVAGAKKTAAFNMTVLSHLLGTPLEPDLAGHVLMLEEVGEAMYRIDRSLFHITSNANVRGTSGIMLGRCSNITPNEPGFGMNEEDLAQYWCRRAGIAWLGRPGKLARSPAQGPAAATPPPNPLPEAERGSFFLPSPLDSGERGWG